MNFSNKIEAVATCYTPYKQKFGIPRQPGLVDVKGYVELIHKFNHIDAVRGLEQYSHIWLLFCFHENLAQGWKTTVRPPRLGGNEKMGVFATRSTFRPNGIGQSVVKLHRIFKRNNKITLEISGMDLLDNTPIIDIKPYIPFSDAIADSQGGIAHKAPELKNVVFTPNAKTQLDTYNQRDESPNLLSLITAVLAQDPRPAYKRAKLDTKRYQVALYDLDIFWCIEDENILVLEMMPSKLAKVAG